MKTETLKLKPILTKTASAFLVFWLSGVLIFACCGTDFFTVSAEEKIESCPLGGGHDCCKKDKDEKKDKIGDQDTNKADCCIFKPVKTLSGELQSSKNLKQSQVIQVKFVNPKPVRVIEKSYQPTTFYHSAVRNRGSTYKKNCVFRI